MYVTLGKQKKQATFEPKETGIGILDLKNPITVSVLFKDKEYITFEFTARYTVMSDGNYLIYYDN